MSHYSLRYFSGWWRPGTFIVVIEHNLEVIKCADWVIDLGPEAGDEGGELVTAGTPEQVAKVEASHTGRYLKPLLDFPRRRGSVSVASRLHTAMTTRSLRMPQKRRPRFHVDRHPAIASTERASTTSRTSRSIFRATRWSSSRA